MVRNKRSLISIKGVDLAFRRADNPDCDRAFDETARAIYEGVASRLLEVARSADDAAESLWLVVV